MRARLGRYFLWQVRDYAIEKGVATLIVSALLLLLAVQTLGRHASDPRDMFLGDAVQGLTANFSTLVAVITLLAVQGIIASDRARGYFRFLFAKPVSVARYYAQAFLVAGLGVMLVSTIYLAGFALIVYPLFPPRALLFAALYFLAFGGLGFLISAITHYDWMVLGVTWALALILRSFIPPDSGWFGRVLEVIMPPITQLVLVGADLLRGESADPQRVTWIAAYGVACFVAGLVIVRLRPLAS